MTFGDSHILFNCWFQIWQQKFNSIRDFWETCKWRVKFLWIQSVLGTFVYSCEKHLLSLSFPPVCPFILLSVCLFACIGTVPTGQISVNLILKTSTNICQEIHIWLKSGKKDLSTFSHCYLYHALYNVICLKISNNMRHTLKILKFSHSQSIFQHVSVVATAITREFTL